MKIVTNGLWGDQEVKPILPVYYGTDGDIDNIDFERLWAEIREETSTEREIVIHTGPEGRRMLDEAMQREIQNMASVTTTQYMTEQESIEYLDTL